MKGEKVEKAASAEKPAAKAKAALPIEKGKEAAAPEKPEPTIGTDGMTPEQRKVFVENKKAAEESSKRVAELEKLVSDREATARERDELRQRLEAREKEMESVDVVVALEKLKRSQEYRETIQAPMQTLINELGKISKSMDVPFDTILDAIENEDEVKGNAELSEIMERLDSMTAKKMERMVDNVRELNRRAESLHQNPHEALNAAALKEKERTEAEVKKSKEVYGRSFDAVIDKFKTLDPSLVKENGELTPEAKEAFDNARTIDWDTTPPDMKAYFAQSGYLLLQKNQKIASLEAENEKLQDSIAKMSNKPKPSGGSPSPQLTEKQTVAGDKPGDRFANWKAGQG